MMDLIAGLHGGAHPGLTAFFSVNYMALFVPAALIFFSLTPNKWKHYALLLISLGFYWLISGLLMGYLLLTAFSIWAFGLWMEHLHARRDTDVKAAERENRKAIKQACQSKCRRILILAVCAQVGLLLVLKYSGFFMTNVNLMLGKDWPVPDFVMPLGISFFTMQAVSYLADVYRETSPGDRNFFRVLLFIAFFPQIVEGPICRYRQTAQQLWDVRPIQYENFLLGSQRILYGLMKKLVAADRLNALVSCVFADVYSYQGGIIAIAAVCYTIQLYMDFSGSMDAVCGLAQIFGITMPENFRRPFFSRTVSEFWTRWHISLGTFFSDYVFYPLSMCKPMKKLTSGARKKLGNHYGPLLVGGIALFCVWLCNGLWHGAAWSYIFFGMYHFSIILIGSLIGPPVKTIQASCHIDPQKTAYRIAQTVRTCILVVIGELFFRAEGLRAGMIMMKRMVMDFSFSSLNGSLLQKLGTDWQDLAIVAVTVGIVFTVSLLQERGMEIRKTLQKQNTAVRWAILYGLILYIVIFGAYGFGYVPVDPMYANF